MAVSMFKREKFYGSAPTENNYRHSFASQMPQRPLTCAERMCLVPNLV